MNKVLKPRLYMMLGYPGAGKTTVAKLIAELTGAFHLSSDEVRAKLFPKPKFDQAEHDQLYEHLDNLTVEALQAGQDVIYDANLNRLEHRKQKYDICRQVGAESVLIWVKTPKELAKDRASHTSRQHLWPENESPDEMFDRIAGLIETPSSDEPHIEIDGTKVSASYIKQKLHD